MKSIKKAKGLSGKFKFGVVSDKDEDREFLIELIYDLLSNLFQRFDFYKLSKEYLANRIDATLKKKQVIKHLL